MDRIFDAMEEHMGLNSGSVLADGGAGLGLIVMHAFIRFKCSAIGLEVEKYRWFMSWLMISNSISKEFRNWGLEECKKKLFMLHADLSDRRIKNYDGITHFITFDVGMPPWVKDHIHKCLKRTERRIYLVCFTPETVLKRD